MKFKVGDRVAVYHGEMFGVADVILIHERKGLHVFDAKGRADWMRGRWFSPKQVRRLVKKARRRIWVAPCFLKHPTPDYGSASVVSKNYVGTDVVVTEPWIEFIEVKKK